MTFKCAPHCETLIYKNKKKRTKKAWHVHSRIQFLSLSLYIYIFLYISIYIEATSCKKKKTYETCIVCPLPHVYSISLYIFLSISILSSCGGFARDLVLLFRGFFFFWGSGTFLFFFLWGGGAWIRVLPFPEKHVHVRCVCCVLCVVLRQYAWCVGACGWGVGACVWVTTS